jgi:ribosomal protein L29
MEEEMRALKTSELKRSSRANLWRYLRSNSKALVNARMGSTAGRVARLNLRRIRQVLARGDLSPY